MKQRISIRLMGDKELALEVSSIIIEALQRHLYVLPTFRSYPVFKDKRKRTEVDPTKIRLYATVEVGRNV